MNDERPKFVGVFRGNCVDIGPVVSHPLYGDISIYRCLGMWAVDDHGCPWVLCFDRRKDDMGTMFWVRHPASFVRDL